MSTQISLTASDAHQLSAYRADPNDRPRGGVLVIQEIFGVNAHIRAVCDDYAAQGYVAIAPALFDRVERGVELGYDGEASRRGISLVTQLKPGDPLKDLQAAVDVLSVAGKVCVVGYCYGGGLAWLAATRFRGLSAASCYYGGLIARFKDEPPKVPTILHFGEFDPMIPMTDVEAIRAARPDVPTYVYPAHHGFNCDVRASYHAESTALARKRTLELFATHTA